jgi:hypothetical protein
MKFLLLIVYPNVVNLLYYNKIKYIIVYTEK